MLREEAVEEAETEERARQERRPAPAPAAEHQSLAAAAAVAVGRGGRGMFSCGRSCVRWQEGENGNRRSASAAWVE